MQPFTCSQCGAVQSLPAALSAIVAHCPFCGQENPLPEEALALRVEQSRVQAERDAQDRVIVASQQRQKTASRTAIITVTLLIGLPVIFSVVFILFISRVVSTATPPIATAISITVSVPAPATPKPPPDAHATGAEQTTARLKNLYNLGCKNVIMPPSEGVGQQTLKTDFVVDGTCVRMLAITGVQSNTLTLEMKTPFGEKIDTPKPSTEVDFTYCPKTPGPHPTTIIPASEEDPYTVSAVECPGSLVKKNQRR